MTPALERLAEQERRCDSMASEIESLWVNVNQLADRARTLEKMIDTRSAPLWKRIVFRIDGWPAWTAVADTPAWRPWRRWWTS